jgi:hypothetical protein
MIVLVVDMIVVSLVLFVVFGTVSGTPCHKGKGRHGNPVLGWPWRLTMPGPRFIMSDGQAGCLLGISWRS